LNSQHFIGFSACFNPSHSESFVAVFSWKLAHFVENRPEVPRNYPSSLRMKTARWNSTGLLIDMLITVMTT